MIYLESEPSPRFNKVIKCFWALKYNKSVEEAEPELVLPDGCPEIVFNLSDPFLRVHRNGVEIQAQAILAGQMKQSILIRPSGNVELFGVRLQPAGARPLLRFPLDHITDQIHEFSSIVEGPAGEIEEQINEARSFGDRIGIFESYLLKRVVFERIDPIVSVASELILHLNGSLPVGRLLDRLDISERNFERRFKRAIGVSPKTFSRIVRFQSVIRAFQDGVVPDLLDAALTFGYYDQSHLNRDFREFSGESPAAYFERTHAISDVFTGAV